MKHHLERFANFCLIFHYLCDKWPYLCHGNSVKIFCMVEKIMGQLDNRGGNSCLRVGFEYAKVQWALFTFKKCLEKEGDTIAYKVSK